jgi:hypothetical protein
MGRPREGHWQGTGEPTEAAALEKLRADLLAMTRHRGTGQPGAGQVRGGGSGDHASHPATGLAQTAARAASGAGRRAHIHPSAHEGASWGSSHAHSIGDAPAGAKKAMGSSGKPMSGGKVAQVRLLL